LSDATAREARAGGRASAGPHRRATPDAAPAPRRAQPALTPLLRLAMEKDMPTNHSMLLMRCANAACGHPNANKDWVAPLFLRELMPAQAGEMFASGGGATAYGRVRRALFEAPGVGVPGLINFLDGRTQWFDQRVAAALDAGVRQARAGGRGVGA
jgi:hypothetical protein